MSFMMLNHNLQRSVVQVIRGQKKRMEKIMDTGEHLSNKKARGMDESELYRIICADYIEVNNRQPSTEESDGLRESAERRKGNLMTRSRVRQAINDRIWSPAEGPRAIYGPA
jgi:hypothetical protein